MKKHSQFLDDEVFFTCLERVYQLKDVWVVDSGTTKKDSQAVTVQQWRVLSGWKLLIIRQFLKIFTQRTVRWCKSLHNRGDTSKHCKAQVINAWTCIINQGYYNTWSNWEFQINLSLSFCLPLNHTSICPQTDCVQFQDHDFVLGSLADFPAILLEEFLADEHLVRLSVLRQAQLAEFLPAPEEEEEKSEHRQWKVERGDVRDKWERKKYIGSFSTGKEFNWLRCWLGRININYEMGLLLPSAGHRLGLTFRSVQYLLWWILWRLSDANISH